MFYLIKTPWLVKKYYSDCVWDIPSGEKDLYLSFDDGPHPVATPFILEQLKKYQAKATFFCIGKNARQEQDLYKKILDEGHRVGNHTYNHLRGTKTSDIKYFEDIRMAARYIDSNLFRPPYGRISKFQIELLKEKFHYKIIMWDVISADFDRSLTGDKCAINVIAHAKPGSIIIFHDSEKAWERLQIALPKVLEYFTSEGYKFKSID
ncbi:MAG: polysaccharide deacetylase family protein [Bacteroidetes bacterium]|nr:MAG: polysaccharide deacetylase family protein [Bacteroidota bacterium]